MDVVYCQCPLDVSDEDSVNESRAKQRWKAGFWPATYIRPQTVFTVHSLRFFEALTLQAKTSAYDFIGTLRRFTNNAFSRDVKVMLRPKPIAIYISYYSLRIATGKSWSLIGSGHM